MNSVVIPFLLYRGKMANGNIFWNLGAAILDVAVPLTGRKHPLCQLRDIDDLTFC